MPNAAQSILLPSDPRVLVRVAFLYVGQGSSAVVFAKDGSGYRTWLVDINLDRKAGGIDVPRLMKDLLGKTGLDAFVNTHPHDDHLQGVEELSKQVAINSVLHSGHKPGRDFSDAYKGLEAVMNKVKKAGGSVEVLTGSRTPFTVGETECYVLAPAEYVADEISDEDPKVRYQRIHDQCTVLKFGKGSNWIMIAGDAERTAFEDYITKYHRERLGAYVLAAPHHGSRTFFHKSDEDEPCLDALNTIDPEFVVVSAPTQAESKHEHPHDDAMELYQDHVGDVNVLHTGEERCSFIFDIYEDGTRSDAISDDGKLAEVYGLSDEDEGDGGSSEAKGPFISPGSKTGDLTPRKFG